MQSRKQSAVEAVTNLAVGYAVAWLLTFTVLPAFGLNPTPGETTAISLIFTVASVVRSYALRRAFVWIERNAKR